MPTQLQRFAAALYPDSTRCLGRRLRPLTVGHILLLARLEHPLVLGQGLYDDASVALGVALCSLPYHRAAAAATRPWFRIRLFWLGIRAWFEQRASLVFARYIVSGATGPKWCSKDRPGQPTEGSGTPFWTNVVVTLQRDLGRAHAAALDTPAATALWLCVPVWEGMGAVEVATDAQLPFIEKAVAS